MGHGLTGYVRDKCRCDICKIAASESRARSYAKNRDADRDKTLAYKKAWYAANIEKERAARNAYAKTEPALAHARERYASNPEKFRVRGSAAYYADVEKSRAERRVVAKRHYDANRQQILARDKEQRAANPEKFRAMRRASYAINREKELASQKVYQRTNPEKFRWYGQLRRSRLAGVDVREITERDWQKLCARYNDRCAYCGGPGPLHKDHIVPITRGGRHSIGNLIPACKSCNSSKKNRLLIEWRGRRISPATNTIR